MKTKLLLLLTLSMFLTFSSFSQPKKIYWVWDDAATDGADQAWVDFLIDKGFDASLYSHLDFTQEKLDFINGASGPDMVIISRAVNSGNFSGSVADLWNAINSPMIMLSPYTVRDSRMHWLPTEDIIQGGVFTQGGTGPEINSMSQIVYPDDYIFRNIDLTTAPDLRYYSGGSSFTPIGQFDVEDFTSGKVLFNNTEGAADLIRFPQGVETYTGSGVFPPAPRTYFPLGTGSGGRNYGPPVGIGIELFISEVNLLLDSTLSVSTVTKQSNFSVWTDREQSTVNVSNKLNALKTIEIFNMTGQTVKAIKNVSANEISIDVADLATGLYIIKIDNNFSNYSVILGKKGFLLKAS